MTWDTLSPTDLPNAVVCNPVWVGSIEAQQLDLGLLTWTLVKARADNLDQRDDVTPNEKRLVLDLYTALDKWNSAWEFE